MLSLKFLSNVYIAPVIPYIADYPFEKKGNQEYDDCHYYRIYDLGKDNMKDIKSKVEPSAK